MDDEKGTIMMDYHLYSGINHLSNHVTGKNCTLFDSSNSKVSVIVMHCKVIAKRL